MDVNGEAWLLLFEPLALGTGWFEGLSLDKGGFFSELQFKHAMKTTHIKLMQLPTLLL
jgi:hypothetical protein